MNLTESFFEVLQTNRDKVAIEERNGREMTFGQLHDAMRAFAAHLNELGFAPGDRVVVQVPNGIAFAVATVGALAAGGVAVLCEPGMGDGTYRAQMDVCAPRWVLVHPLIVWINRIPGARRYLAKRDILIPPLVDGEPGRIRIMVNRKVVDRIARSWAGSIWDSPSKRDLRDDAVVVFTGGTTTEPKGVRLSHGALSHYLQNIGKVIEGLGIECFLADTPQEVLYGLRLGKTVLVREGKTKRKAADVTTLIRTGRVDGLFASPYLVKEMLAQSGGTRERLPSSLKAILMGGAPVTQSVMRELRGWLDPSTQVLSIYGLTEAGPVCAASDTEKLSWTETGDYIGRPLPDVRVTVEGGEGDDVGELTVHSPALYTGYLKEDERPHDAGLKTGDIARLIRSEGGTAVVLLGRSKDMIIRAAVKVYPQTIEPALLGIRGMNGTAAFRECALVGVWNAEKEDEEIVLCYEFREGGRLDKDVMRSKVTQITGPSAAPDYYMQVAPFPVVGRLNKVNKAALRKLAAQRLGMAPQHDSTRGV